MDVSCPSLPPKIFRSETLRPNEQTSVYMAARGCHFVVCFRFVLVFSIEGFSLRVRDQCFARTILYKLSSAIVSSIVTKLTSRSVRASLSSVHVNGLPSNDSARFHNGWRDFFNRVVCFVNARAQKILAMKKYGDCFRRIETV